MQQQITLESLNDKLDELLKKVEELHNVTVINGGDMPISYTRDDFNQYLFNIVTFRIRWAKVAAVVGAIFSVLSIVNIFKTWVK
jgi:hypothetical protein